MRISDWSSDVCSSDLIIAEQTRVYHFDESAGTWEIGRLLDDHGDSQFVQFPNSKSKHLKSDAVFVRWARPILDPTPFLANRINESPRFSDGRSSSEGARGGKEGGSECRTRWSP